MLLATIDLETLALEANAVILSVGICIFDNERLNTHEELVSQGINIYFDQDSQAAKGRKISQSTLEWWSEQGESAQECLNNPNKIAVRDFYAVFNKLCADTGMGDTPYHPSRKKLKWYARGPHFDISKMDDLFTNFNVTSPWKYYNIRDIRTWLECNGLEDNLKLVKPSNMIPHNSLHDAAFDAWMMQQVKNNKDNLVIDLTHVRE